MGIHDGHRERLKLRYLREGGKNFEPHNLMELLLFFSIPRRDTNEIAHLLLKQFGDVYGVLTAPPEEICKVKGVSQNTATLLRLVGDLGARFCNGETNSLVKFTTFDDIGKSLIKQYASINVETVIAMFFTPKGELIKSEVMCNGNLSSARLSPPDIVAKAYSCGAPHVIIAHNHPRGVAFPSSEDIESTRRIQEILKLGGIDLLEHFIIADSNYYRLGITKTEDFSPAKEVKDYKTFQDPGFFGNGI